ncbi:pilus assembly protein CpaB [Variovorax paradoxus]|jgi:pilus assembly protein CpaB|uniref:Flp pilus assembly protein CpaB n=1 Tax=Variovorax paradoxus TaxID=34073 RepID=UPI0006E528D1|nr:pilus assembly protein CpaB [Variovorax paradoxus]KPU97995.1 pilus assembly protein CpaB [Variovorax paradoxus]KPV00706.1 pilus assembly protein CpaB [Variovorax paradoxus]KPV16307.1 pilus assembly protein CpaB [Variovorax paradoxus]KPV27353.1 pilus assembly protein CpaB [Variovorax paradoxus]
MIHLTKIIAAILVLIAIALGGYAWVLSRQPAPSVAATPATSAPARSEARATYPVVVASKPLPAGKAIAADAVRVEQLPVNPSDAFKETSVVAGRVPVLDLSEGTPIQEGQLVSGLALRIGEGERAVAVKADEVMGVGNKVQPGDFVDVFVMLKSEGKDIDRSQARLLLARKRLLAYGSLSVDALATKAADNGATAAQRAEAARTAVLAIPVDDVNRLTLGESSGRLLLALRNPADTTEPDPSLFAELPTALQPVPAKPGEPRRPPLAGLDKAQAGLTVADLVNGGATPATSRRTAITGLPIAGTRPAGIARPGMEVEVIRGDRSETVRY